MSWITSDVPREFSAEDLLIRCLRASDAKQMVDAITESLPELRQWMPWARYEPQSVIQREAFIQGWDEDWLAKKDFPFGINHEHVVLPFPFDTNFRFELSAFASTSRTKI